MLQDPVVALSADDVETLAALSHDRFRESIAPGSPAARRAWSELDDAGREANRDSVRFIPAIVRALGYEIAPVAPEPDAAVAALDEEEVDAAARLEHLRWARLTRRQGRTDHPDLVPWSDLDEPTRERDRMRVRAIPDLLRQVDLWVRR